MTRPGRQPWWYSGDDEGPAADAPGTTNAAEGAAGPERSQGGDSATGVDWTALVVGAQRVVEWATERVMAPHAEHAEPAEHPECMVCRTLVVLGESGAGPMPPAPDAHEAHASGAQVPADPGEADPMSMPRGPGQIQWIPIREETVEP